MTLAIVILNWNGRKLLEEFLPSVVAHSKEATLYLADNASTDDSIEFVSTYYPSIKIIKNKQNFGYARGYNEALKEVSEDIFCLLNSDIEVTHNWLQPIIDLFKSKEDCAIIQPKILDYKDKEYFEYAGAAGGFIDKFGFPFCRGRIFNTLEKDKKNYKTEKIFWASGACFFIKKDVFFSLNGFDEDFFAHQEEIDMCWRAFNNDYNVYCCSDTTVYHVGGATLTKGSPKKTFLNFRNSLFMMYKNLPKKSLFWIIFIRLCFDGLAGIQFLIQGKPMHTLQIAKAHFYFYYYIPKLSKKREIKIKSNYYHSKSIVWSYFLANKKYFTSLI